MSYLSRFFMQKPMPAKPNSTKKPIDHAASVTGFFEFNEGILADEDKDYAQATFKTDADGSGSVFFDFKHSGKQKIGSFKKDPGSNRTLVFRVSDGEEIGFIDDDGCVYLSRAGIHNSAIKRGFYERFPDPVFKEIGRMLGCERGGVFDQAGTHEIIGSYTGKRAAAGAALISLIYEIHSHGWHSFYNYS